MEVKISVFGSLLEVRREIVKIEEKKVMIRNAGTGDFSEILRMNQESVHFLSPMGMEKLEHLDQESNYHKVVVVDGKIVAFCLAFREGADYDSVNYQWFSREFDQFLYVDRVVVDIAMQGHGLGELIYQDVFQHAADSQVPRVTAEIDFQPPNPVSLKFHEKFGFREVGRQEVYGGEKVVSLQSAEIGECLSQNRYED